MKTLKLFSIVFITVLVATACGPSKKEKINRINEMENELFAEEAKGIDKEKARSLTDAYIAYADAFPEDSLAPEYLFRAADISMNIFESGQAIDLYNRITDDYPDYRKAPQCLFLKAFVYENNLNDLNNAKRYYREFLDKYPEDEFADDAEMSLQNLGKSPEQLIKEFEERMAASEEGN